MHHLFAWVMHLTPLSPLVPAFIAFIGLFRKEEPSMKKMGGEARLGSWSFSFHYHHDSRKQ